MKQVIYTEKRLEEILEEIENDLDDVCNERFADVYKRRLTKNLKQKRNYYLKKLKFIKLNGGYEK